MTLAALKLRRGARVVYEYDLNIPWRHEVRIEGNGLDAVPGKSYPTCTAGDGNGLPEDCGGPRGYLAGLDNASSWDTFDDLDTMADILREVVLEDRPDVLKDQETRWRLEDAVERSKARERPSAGIPRAYARGTLASSARGIPFVRRTVNARLRRSQYQLFMHQLW